MFDLLIGSATLLTTFELCLDCAKTCRRSGPPWRRLECSLFSGTESSYEEDQVVDMTDAELVERVAFG